MPFDAATQESELVRDLRAARAYLVEHGWCQGRGRDDAGRVCAIGAFNAVIAPIPGNGGRVRAVAAALSMLSEGILTWNDAPGRTVDDVLALYDRAIDRALVVVEIRGIE